MYPIEPEDRDLLRRAQEGQGEAFDQLVEGLTPGLYRIVRRMMPDRAEAESVVQETWIRAWKRREHLDPSLPAFPWLARIALNIARDQLRKRWPIDFADVGEELYDHAEPNESLEKRLERQDAREQLARAIEALRPEWRMILALRYDGGLAYAEIAEALGVPLNTVRTHLRRAHLTLRQRLEADDG